jgi:hypothetical protein
MVLVTAALALLVLIAAGFLTRTRSGRLTSIAHRDVRLADNNAQLIASMIADEIAQALFVRPIDTNDPLLCLDPTDPNCVANANTPRLQPQSYFLRYGADPTDLYVNDGTFLTLGSDDIPDFPYNSAPYHVVPFTNWPDATGDPAYDILLPPGDGNAQMHLQPSPIIVQREGNPLGNPGFGDNRWLADAEPMRWDIDGDGRADRYTHWRKLSNLSRPGNGWRICRDISNVFVDLDNPADGIHEAANIVADLTIPVEQWLAVRPDNIYAASEDAVFPDWDPGLVPFETRWGLDDDVGWLPAPTLTTPVALGGYLGTYWDNTLIPANFYRLCELDGDGIKLEDGEEFRDTFRRGTPRWNVGRVLADADGDGHTDAFWHLVPTLTERGIRQVVAVRIVDNSAMLNFNVASRFVRADNVDYRRKTRGQTPADLALVGDLSDTAYLCGISPPCNLHVGLFDNFEHHEDYFNAPNPPFPSGYDPFGLTRVRWWPLRWRDHLAAVGIWDGVDGNVADELLAPDWERLLYWQASGRRPLDPELGLTPFNFGDELELRMYHGNNHSKIHTRFEASVLYRDDNDPRNSYDLLHSDWEERHETSEAQEQLRNRELLADLRSKLTAYNGARNDLMPPWLWWRWQLPAGYLVDTLEANNFLAQARRKVDLREEPGGPGLYPGERTMAERLPTTLLHALSQSFPRPNPPGDVNFHAHFGHSYFGDFNSVSADGLTVTDPNFNKLRRLAAGYAANILAYRDADDVTYLNPINAVAPAIPGDAVPLPQVDDILRDRRTRFVGLEMQPFLVEAFLAHVYQLAEAQWDHEPGVFGEPQVLAGHRVLCSGLEPSTMVVVQIANPYDRPVTLIEYDANGDPVYEAGALVSKFELSVFGQTLDLGHPQLQPPPPNLLDPVPNLYVLRPGEARTYYAIEADPAPPDPLHPISRGDWVRILGLEAPDPDDPDPLDFVDLNTWVDLVADYPGVIGLMNAWSTERLVYDDDTRQDQAIELRRRMKRYDGDLMQPLSVVVDRIDVKPGLAGEPAGGGYRKFGERVVGFESLVDDPTFPNMDNCQEPVNVPPAPPEPYWHVRNFRGSATHVAQIASASRVWRPVDADGTIADNERNPSFVFANRHVDTKTRWKYTDTEPTDLWLTGTADDPHIPDFSRRQEDVPEIGDDFDFPLQMLQKDDDFEQVGELLHVWLQAHELAFQFGGTYDRTETTFSEFMREDLDAIPANAVKTGVNRLRMSQTTLVGVPATVGPLGGVYLDDPMHLVPAMPAGARVLDAFVCDGPGIAPLTDLNNDSVVDERDQDLRRYLNANGFSGALTPGLVNINTATREVLRSLPHWYRAVHEEWSPTFHPYVHLPEAVVQYRDRLGMFYDDTDVLPAYGDRGRKIENPTGSAWAPGFRIGLRSDRGIASIGELLLLERAGKMGKDTASPVPPFQIRYVTSGNAAIDRDNILYNSSFRMDYPTVPERSQFETDVGTLPLNPNYPNLFQEEFPLGSGQFFAANAQVSTDVMNPPDLDLLTPPNPVAGWPDDVAEDAEEANVLFAGASNMLTTRSDVFTVYFRVRSFRQNPVTGAWDATDPEAIVEENRYVMLVDRSGVNRPSDSPKILYMEQLPP